MIQHDLLPRPATVSDARPNRGRLKNGNPPGDYMKAPRCGAKTRIGGCGCRQPAMRNGRCRFHGGRSTGARTAEGRARCARARRTHGFYSAETVALRREAQTLLRRNRDLLAALRDRPAGHGVDRSDSVNRKGAKTQSTPAAFASSRLCGDLPSSFGRAPAGHGVLRSFLRLARTAVRWLGRLKP